jgi:hypothetical protein
MVSVVPSLLLTVALLLLIVAFAFAIPVKV